MEKFAVSVAKKAGNFLLKNFRRDRKLLRLRDLSKGIVTKYDKASDKLIIKLLSKNTQIIIC